MFQHILPNVLGPVLVIATINLALAIITEATLSFLGVGLPPTEPSLGTMIQVGNKYLFSGSWWMVAFPGLTLALLALAVNLLGDWLRDALNPKLQIELRDATLVTVGDDSAVRATWFRNRAGDRVHRPACLAAGAADAQADQWARSGDALTLDPHAQNEGPTHNLLHQIYEPLILRDRTGKLLPDARDSPGRSPADPTVWEFKLRQGVKFHNGNAFNADDVVFSLERALQPTSDMKGLLTSIEKVSKVDDYTVHIKTKGPNPLLPDYLTNLYMMDKEWSRGQQHGHRRRTTRTRRTTSPSATPTAPGPTRWCRASRTCKHRAQAQRRLLGQGPSCRSASPRSPT